ncbi:murein hydrolase activator EnvC family protein [Cellulomonas bogoriensis]
MERPGTRTRARNLGTGLVLVLLVALGHSPTQAAQGGGPPLPEPTGVYTLPVTPTTVLELFDPPPAPWAPGHRGVDLSTTLGAEVRAPGSGTVTFAGTVVNRGVLTITHDDGLRSSLEPVTAAVSVGDRVALGQVVAHVTPGHSHCEPTCLHWGVREGDLYLDPLSLLGPVPPVVLLP